MNVIKQAWRFLFVSDESEKRCGYFIPHKYVTKEHTPVMEETGEYVDGKPILKKRYLDVQVCKICGDTEYSIV